jgi:hypothetical protein
MSKRYSDFVFELGHDPDAEHLDLRLPSAVVARIDAAMETEGISSREEFAFLAVMWALKSLDEEAEVALMGLEEESQP